MTGGGNSIKGGGGGCSAAGGGGGVTTGGGGPGDAGHVPFDAANSQKASQETSLPQACSSIVKLEESDVEFVPGQPASTAMAWTELGSVRLLPVMTTVGPTPPAVAKLLKPSRDERFGLSMIRRVIGEHVHLAKDVRFCSPAHVQAPLSIYVAHKAKCYCRYLFEWI